MASSTWGNRHPGGNRRSLEDTAFLSRLRDRGRMSTLTIRFASGAAPPRMRLIDAMTDGDVAATSGWATKPSSRYLLHVTFMTEPRQGADRPALTRGAIAAGDSICHSSANCSPGSSHEVTTSSRLPSSAPPPLNAHRCCNVVPHLQRCTAMGEHQDPWGTRRRVSWEAVTSPDETTAEAAGRGHPLLGWRRERRRGPAGQSLAGRDQSDGVAARPGAGELHAP